MQPKLNCLLFSVICFLSASAQKKNYLSIETGVYFGNANKNIEDGMRVSGFADKSTASFFGLFSWTTDYPVRRTENSFYRIRGGHFFKQKMAIEGGYGLSYGGTVQGYDEGSGSANYLALTSKINSLEFALMLTDSTRRVGIGIGPVFNFYRLETRINSDPPISRNYFLPGVMTTAYVNLLSNKSWFLGFRTGASITGSAKIAEINASNSSLKSSTYKTTKAGSFNGYFSIQAGFRFTKK